MRNFLPTTGSRMPRRYAAVMVSLVALAGGCTTPLPPTVASGQAAYDMFPTIGLEDTTAPSVIGPSDEISVTVFQEPDLSVKEVKIDPSGNLLLPLIGNVQVTGKTAPQVSAEIERLLGAKYLRDPQVTVSVSQAVSQRVSVQGSVKEGGVFPLTGRTTLLEAVAMAKGTSDTARLSEVVVFRRIKGQRQAAVFNLKNIQRGIDPDPEVQGGDMVVVGLNNLKSGFREVLGTSNLLNVFRPF